MKTAKQIVKFMIFTFLTILGLISIEALMRTEYPVLFVISFFGMVVFLIIFYYLDKEV